MLEMYTEPLSDNFGYDRGTPIDRHYIKMFLDSHADLIVGHSLEVKDDRYSQLYTDKLAKSSVVDIKNNNPLADIVADLTIPESLPSSSFDCIFLTQTVQYFTDIGSGLKNCYQALRPGGTVFITTPALGRLCRRDPDADLWRFTPAGFDRVLAEHWEGTYTAVTRGNLRASVGQLIGAAAEELGLDALADDDPRFPLLMCVVARRPAADASSA